MSTPATDSDELLMVAASGDEDATQALFLRHRDRLRRMVRVRMDPRLAARLDPSDVVQDALMDASRKFSRYLEARPLPFYPWLRQLTLERLLELHRRHIAAGKRTANAEVSAADCLSQESAWQLAARLSRSAGSAPVERLIREEEQRRLHDALGRLLPHDREILVLRYLEQLSTTEAAGALGVSESAAKMRHLRALERIRSLLDPPSS